MNYYFTFVKILDANIRLVCELKINFMLHLEIIFFKNPGLLVKIKYLLGLLSTYLYVQDPFSKPPATIQKYEMLVLTRGCT